MISYRSDGLSLCVIFSIVLMLLSGCSSSKTAYKLEEKMAERHYDFDRRHISEKRKRICSEAVDWVGTPYRYAMQDKKVGTDCSGMVLAVFNNVLGVKLPRNSAKQASFCKEIDLKDLRPGDLLFFATGKDPDRISHVGIALSREEFVHASTSKGVVVSKINTPYYSRTLRKCALMPE